jgi:hypothetical protein
LAPDLPKSRQQALIADGHGVHTVPQGLFDERHNTFAVTTNDCR